MAKPSERSSSPRTLGGSRSPLPRHRSGRWVWFLTLALHAGLLVAASLVAPLAIGQAQVTAYRHSTNLSHAVPNPSFPSTPPTLTFDGLPEEVPAETPQDPQPQVVMMPPADLTRIIEEREQRMAASRLAEDMARRNQPISQAQPDSPSRLVTDSPKPVTGLPLRTPRPALEAAAENSDQSADTDATEDSAVVEAPTTETNETAKAPVSAADEEGPAQWQPPTLKTLKLGDDLRRKLRRNITFEATIDADGRVESLTLIEGSGNPRLDQALLRALRGCEFTPALRKGVATRAILRQTLRPRD